MWRISGAAIAARNTAASMWRNGVIWRENRQYRYGIESNSIGNIKSGMAISATCNINVVAYRG